MGCLHARALTDSVADSGVGRDLTFRVVPPRRSLVDRPKRCRIVAGGGPTRRSWHQTATRRDAGAADPAKRSQLGRISRSQNGGRDATLPRRHRSRFLQNEPRPGGGDRTQILIEEEKQQSGGRGHFCETNPDRAILGRRRAARRGRASRGDSCETNPNEGRSRKVRGRIVSEASRVRVRRGSLRFALNRIEDSPALTRTGLARGDFRRGKAGSRFRPPCRRGRRTRPGRRG